MNIQQFKQKFHLPFENQALLKQAFTHSSYVNEHTHKNLADNERLEFLGDAVLEIAVSDFLYRSHQAMTEGELSKLRANIVCEESLYRFATILQLDEYILLGKGEERTGGRKRHALLADVFEAFLGAIYLDQGIATAQAFLEEFVFPHIIDETFSHVTDYKSELQELVQEGKNKTLVYRIIEEKGPSHQKEFHAEVIINKEHHAKGVGRTKKEAEQDAAKNMLEKM